MASLPTASRRAAAPLFLGLVVAVGSSWAPAQAASEEKPARVERPVDLDQRSREAAADRWYREGRTFLGQGHFDEARDCLRAAIQLDPECIGAHKGLAKAYQGLHQYEREIEVLRRAIELNPVPEGTDSSGELVQTEPRLWLYVSLATSLRRQGEESEAHATLRSALDHDPGFWSASRLLATWLHEEEELQASDRVLDAAFDHLCTPKEGPLAEARRVQAQVALAELYAELGRPGAARRFAR